ncbi:MAG: efflux RND transporter periplasmic adaptor subunit [Firmicutes bacterium]|nr:efflux RND transporter periplasmic adaptor subunit [Bacillota bacterium]
MLHTRSRKLLCLLLIGIMAVMGGCGAKEEEPVTSAAIVVDAAHPHRGDLVLSNQFIGSISAAESVSIMPMASGEITKVYVSIGDSVKAGQTLAKIDDEPGRLQLASAQAQYETLLASKQSNTGASWDLKMMQTDFNIEQLQDAIDAYEDQKDDLEDTLDDLEDQLDDLEDDRATLKKQQKELEAAIANAVAGGMPEAAIAEMQGQLTALKSGISELDKGIKTIEGYISETESGIDQIETGIESYEKQLALAEDSAELTKTQVLEETNAALDAQLNAAQVGIDSAKMALSYYNITTPISGRVEAVNVTDHGMAAAGYAAFVVSNKDTMNITFSVSEAVRNTLSVGQKITVERNGVNYDAAITEVPTSASGYTGMFTIKASVNATGDELLSGTSAKITAATYTAKDAMLIPYSAIHYNENQAYVYIVRDGVAAKTNVSTGIFDDDYIVITGGLTENDLVITSWSARLRDGASVTVPME